MKTNTQKRTGSAFIFALMILAIASTTALAQNSFPTPTGIVNIADRDGGGCCAQVQLIVDTQQTHLYSYGSGYGSGSFQIHKYGPGSAGGPVFTILNGGNVGIGTTSPGYKLDVNGTINATGIFVNGSPISGGSSQWSGTSSVAYILGNVGIGTSGPTSRLQVQGTQVGISVMNNASTQNYYFGINDSDANKLYIGRGKDPSQGMAPAVTVDTSDRVGIGTSAPSSKLHVQGDGRFTGSLTVDGSISAKYQDVAEWVSASEQLPAGTVVVLDAIKSNQITSSTQSYDTRVAGVVSTQPGIALGESGDNKVLVATTGRVLVKVDASRAPIHIGDLLVTSDVPGLAMKSEPVNLGGVQLHRPGTLIGKALEPMEKGSGKILVLLSLQ